jgi:hypothetical protein
MVRGDRSVDVFVRKLRQKLEKASPDWRYIHTHFGIGYRFAAERAMADASAGEGAPDGAAGETQIVDTPDAAASEATQSGAIQTPATHSGASVAVKAGELDLGDRDVRDQGELGRAQQEYELSATGA